MLNNVVSQMLANIEPPDSASGFALDPSALHSTGSDMHTTPSSSFEVAPRTSSNAPFNSSSLYPRTVGLQELDHVFTRPRPTGLHELANYVFDKLDLNKDGVIDRDEFTNLHLQ